MWWTENLRETRRTSESTTSSPSTPLSPCANSKAFFFPSEPSSIPVTQKMESRKYSVPEDSPLLTKPPLDSRRKRYRSFNKDLRRAKSFRASRERSSEKVVYHCTSHLSIDFCLQAPAPFVQTVLPGQKVAFSIKKHNTGRGGWKIIPEEDNIDLKMMPKLMEEVMKRIRQRRIFVVLVYRFLVLVSCSSQEVWCLRE